MGQVDPRIARILGKLELVRGKRIETFGSESHGFSLGPPLSDTAITALEASLGVALPDAYRLFLLQAGASGAGPYYGLLPADRWDDAGEDHKDGITIADQGCAYYALLVISGPERGRVRYINGDGGAPFLPENPDFLSWYERWLDELLWGYEHFWFGTQMPGDEATLAAAARPADGPRRLDALLALHQLPTLAEETREVVALRVRDADPKVRAAALELAKKKNVVPLIEPHVRAGLAHTDATVRESALEALVAAELAWHDEARRLLDDPDDSVVTTAAQALGKAGVLTGPELVRVLARPGARNPALDLATTTWSSEVFDAVLALPPTPPTERYDRRMNALLAQVRKGELDAPRRAQAYALVKELMTRTGRLPAAVFTGLGYFVPHEPDALQLLIGLTRDPEPFNRYDAAAWLGQIGDADALPALRALVDDPAMPRGDGVSTAWSVGANAKKAIAKIEESLAKRS